MGREIVTPELIERVEAEVLGWEIALECEQAVVAHLMQYRRQWDARKTEATPLPASLTRRVRQLLDSEHTVTNLKRQVEDLRALLEARL